MRKTGNPGGRGAGGAGPGGAGPGAAPRGRGAGRTRRRADAAPGGGGARRARGAGRAAMYLQVKDGHVTRIEE